MSENNALTITSTSARVYDQSVVLFLRRTFFEAGNRLGSTKSSELVYTRHFSISDGGNIFKKLGLRFAIVDNELNGRGFR